MTKEPTEAQIKDACYLFGWDYHEYMDGEFHLAASTKIPIVARLIAKHEAFRQHVSEIAIEVQALFDLCGVAGDVYDRVTFLIQPAPEPTPAEVLAEAIKETWWAARSPESFTDALNTYLTGIGFDLAPIKEKM